MNGLPTARRLKSWTSEATSRGGFTVAVLAVVLTFASLVRILPAGSGLPYLHEWDEPQISSTALHMMKTGDLNPHFFHYGSLTLYAQLGVDVLHYFYLLGREPIPFPVEPGIFEHEEVDLGAIETWFETGFLWEVSHPSFYLWNRGFNALLGTATVLVAFLLGRALAGRGVGLLAAALLAVQGFHIERSAMVNPDVAMALFALLSVYGSVLFAEHGSRRALVWALVCCGLAASAKYNGIFCVLAPLSALVAASRRGAVAARLWWTLPTVPVLAFLVTTPYAILDLPAFLSQAGFELYHYAARGHGAVPVEPGWEHLAVQTRRVGTHFGVLPGLLALGGAAVLLRRRAGLVALVYPVFYFLYMATNRAELHRNLLVIYPVLAVAAAVLVLFLDARFVREGKRSPWRIARFALGFLAALLVGWQALGAVRSGWEVWNRRETRSLAVDAVAQLAGEVAPGGGARVGLAEELRFHPTDLARLDLPYEVRPHLDLVCDAESYDLLATGARYVGLWPTKPEAKRHARRLNEAVLDGVERREIGGPPTGFNVTRVDALSKDPVVWIYLTRKRAARRPEICESESHR